MRLPQIYRIFPRAVVIGVILCVLFFVFLVHINANYKAVGKKFIGPDDLAVGLEASDYYLRRGEVKKAEGEISEALVFSPTNIYALEKLFKIKDSDETYGEITRVEETLQKRPDYQAAWLKLANLYENIGRDDLADGARAKAAKLTTI